MTDPAIFTLIKELSALTGYVSLNCHIATFKNKTFYFALYNHGMDHFYCTTHRELIKELERRVEFYNKEVDK